MEISLTEQVRTELAQATATTRQVHQWRRYRTIQLLAEGQAPPQVAAVLGWAVAAPVSIAVNLLNLRPEICTLLLIRSPEWYQRHTHQDFPQEQFHFSQEWANTVRSENYLKSALNSVPYRATDEDLIQIAQLYPRNVAPPGAAAFWLGIDLLRRVL